jgi:lysophospholipase L1-like esterase
VALVTIHPVIEAYVKERHPKHPQRADMQAWLAAYDQGVRRVAQARKLGLIDWRSRVEKQGGASVSADSLLRCVANGGGRDGVHLTAQAQALLGRCVFEAVGAGVKAGETVVCFGDSLTFGSGAKAPEPLKGRPILRCCVVCSSSADALRPRRRERTLSKWMKPEEGERLCQRISEASSRERAAL